MLFPFFCFASNSTADTLKPKSKLVVKSKHKVKSKDSTVTQKTVTIIAEDPRIVNVRKQMGWDWMQEKPGKSIFDIAVSSAIPGQDPITALFTGPTVIRSIQSPNFSDGIDYYFLEALRTYVFSPGSNPIGEIWHFNEGSRTLYGNYLQDYHDEAFWKLAITATLDDAGGNMQQCRTALEFIHANGPDYITVAKQAFLKGNDVLAMFALMYPQRHNMDACKWLRGTYRTDKKRFVSLVNSF